MGDRTVDQGSFRDPAGRLVRHGGRIFRFIQADAAAVIRAFLATTEADRYIRMGRLVSTRFLDLEAANDAGLIPPLGGCVLEHEAIPFPSYPYEWPAEMLHRAAALTLELSETVLEAGFWLKDATPYNVLFRGSEAVFVDLPSFERRDPLDCTWRAYAQFARTFLLPLLARQRLGRNPAELLLTHRDGVDPREMYGWANTAQRLRRGFFGMVTLPVWLDRWRNPDSTQLYRGREAASPEQAQFILSRVYGSLRRSLKRVAPRDQQSQWTGYLEHKSLYTPEALAAKEAFVREALTERRPFSVLDVGCNEGRFSEIAAEAGAHVVAIDSDAAVAGKVFETARKKRLNILPLVVDLARPTPAVGWDNRECLSFLDRARGKFDAVLMLAVLHHLTITERVPLRMVMEMASTLTRYVAVVEFVGSKDPMFQRLLRGRGHLHQDLTVEQFEKEAACYFTTIRKQKLPGLDRWLYLLAKQPRAVGWSC